jgi:exodeoxyribonuclease V gamma subunit
MAGSVAIQQVLPFGNAAADLPRPAGNAGAARTGLRLHYSNRTERLLEALIEKLGAARQRPGASLFDAATVVVPNRQIAAYLKFGIARAAGIASNLRMPFLRDFLKDVIADCRPDFRIVAGSLLRGLLLDLLCDPALLAEEELAPLCSYLFAAGEDPDAVDLRRWQLSGQIAHLLEEYDYSRPEMLDAWAAGRRGSPDKDHDADAERWQRRLWRELWGAGGRVDRRGRAAGQTWLTAPAAFRSLRPEEIARTLPRQVHVFGISYAARAFHEIFAALSRATDLHLYTVAPCFEFEEDAGTGPGTLRRKLPSRAERIDPANPADSEDPYRLTQEAETPALRLWGRPGRENIRLLHERAECELLPCFDVGPERESSLLRQLQRDVLAREPEREAPDSAAAFDGDRSLGMFACPGVRRELETIAAEIWSLVAADDAPGAAAGGRAPLRFNDIAVILPAVELAAYQAHTASVFREAYDIPYNLVDLSLSSESRLAEAAGLLLDLPFGRFTRQELLRVAAHPCVIGRFPDADPKEWLDWCERLGIFHGADHADHCDTYIERDLCNWDQGVKRLALGAFLSGRRSGEERVYESGGERYLPEETGGSLGSAAGFAALVRSLMEDARFCRGRKLTVPGWIAFLQDLFNAYFVPQSEEDERALLRCLAKVESLEELDLGDRQIGYRIPCEFLKAEIASLSGNRGQYLADGVVVSSFLPMRAIPFRIIFIAGLGEGRFPAADRRNPLDLRQARRRAGDVSPREQDKYMFLETLLCARDRLYLSWVARDSLTGDPISPSSVIRELRHFLERGYLGENGFERLVRRPPLRRYDEPPAALDRLAPAARAEKEACDLGGDLRRYLGESAVPSLSRFAGSMAPGDWTLLASRLGVALPPEAPERAAAIASAPVERISVSISMLRKFLECPLQGSARAYLNLREDDAEEDLLSREDETLETGVIPRIMLLRAAFLEAIGELSADAPSQERRAEVFARAYDRRAALLELEGKLPTGPFGAAERERHMGVLEEWWKGFPHLVPAGSGLKVYRFGRAEEYEAVDEVLGPIVLEDVALEGRRARIEISGKTDPVVEDAPGSLLLVYHKADELRRQKDCIRAFFDHVVLAASGERAPGPYRACLLLSDSENEGGSRHVEVFDAITREEARSYLATLCQEMLRSGNDRLLPCEAVLQFHENPSKDLDEIIDKLRNTEFGVSFRYGPVPRPGSYPSPATADALATIDRRFGLYFRKRRAADSSR